MEETKQASHLAGTDPSNQSPRLKCIYPISAQIPKSQKLCKPYLAKAIFSHKKPVLGRATTDSMFLPGHSGTKFFNCNEFVP